MVSSFQFYFFYKIKFNKSYITENWMLKISDNADIYLLILLHFIYLIFKQY